MTDFRGVFVTGAGTAAGKTFASRGLACALSLRGLRTLALKPIETGCQPDPEDALALARACRRPELARDPAFYRAALPLAPYAAMLSDGTPSPDLRRIAARIRDLAAAADFTLVEGAGGLLVPLDANATIADLAVELRLPLLLVAPDCLGVLSQVLTAYESAVRRSLTVAAVILTRVDPEPDASTATNAQILSARLPSAVRVLPHSPSNDDALAAALESTGIPDLLLAPRAT